MIPTKLTNLAAIREALATPGARLVRNARFNPSTKFWVQFADGRRVPCSGVADRLTYGTAKRSPAVKFIERTDLELYYA